VALQTAANKSKLDNYLANHSQRQLDRHNSSVTHTQNVLQTIYENMCTNSTFKCNYQINRLNCSIYVINMLNLYTCKNLF